MTNRPRVLIEDRFPIETIGCESMRDASAARKPPLNRLHVWWARRPLTASRAALLASVLPTWTESLARFLQRERERERERERDERERERERERPFRSVEEYEEWFIRLCGIFGDPVAGRAQLARARESGQWISNPYTHDRALHGKSLFGDAGFAPASPQVRLGQDQADRARSLRGGRVNSVRGHPLRLRHPRRRTESRPRARFYGGTLDYPFAFGPSLKDDIRKYGNRLVKRLQKELRPAVFVRRGRGRSCRGGLHLGAHGGLSLYGQARPARSELVAGPLGRERQGHPPFLQGRTPPAPASASSRSRTGPVRTGSIPRTAPSGAAEAALRGPATR